MIYALDKDDKIVYAKNLTETHKGLKYYCPNPSCSGEFLSKNLNSNYKSSCFYYQDGITDKFSNPLLAHIKGCWALSSNNATKYNKDTFDFTYFLDNLSTSKPNNTSSTANVKTSSNTKATSNSTDKKIPIRSIKQLYTACEILSPNDKIGDHLVKDILVNPSTISYYKKIQKEYFTPRLFVLIKIYKIENFNDFTFQARCKNHNNLFLDFIIKVSNKNDFNHLINSFFKNKDGTKFEKPKLNFIILGNPGRLIRKDNTSFFIQEIILEDLKHIHLL